MIHPKIEALVASKMLDFMIPADNVANVIDQHTLSTGLLILTQSNYTMIPVLSAESKLMGVISMSMIIKAVMTVDAIEMERLDELKVRDVMLSQPVACVFSWSGLSAMKGFLQCSIMVLDCGCSSAPIPPS